MKKILAVMFTVALLSVEAMAVPFNNPVTTPTVGFDAGTVLIDFDSLATGALQFDAYIADGVASITQTNLAFGSLEVLSGSPQSAPNYISTGPLNGYSGTALIEFTGLTDRVGIGLLGGSGIDVMSVYDSSMSLLETASITPGTNVFQGFDRASNDIGFFEIRMNFAGLDNLVFNPLTSSDGGGSGGTGGGSHPVPEPGGIILLSIGIALLILASKKNRVMNKDLRDAYENDNKKALVHLESCNCK